MYNWIGKIAVRYSLRYARQRYRRHGRIALGVAGVAAAAIAAYLATREVPEG